MIRNLQLEIWDVERRIDRLVAEHARISHELDGLAQELETKRLVLMSESCELTVPAPRPTFMAIEDVGI